MNRSTKKLSFLDRFYKKYCCGAKNHPILHIYCKTEEDMNNAIAIIKKELGNKNG